MSQMPKDPADEILSPSARAADAADLMAVAMGLGVGLPAGVERQSVMALEGVARTLRDGDGSDTPEAVDAILSIVPAPARGIMQLAAAGGDVRTLLGFLERMVALDRRRRWDGVLAVIYPAGVALCAVLGIVVLAIVQDPLLTTLAEPIQVAVPQELSSAATPVWDAVAGPAGVAAAIVAALAVVWAAGLKRRSEASRRRAAVACELQGISDEIRLSAEQRDEILDDLRSITPASSAAPAFPPLAAYVSKQLSAGQRAFSPLAAFYRETSDAVAERRVQLLPVVGAMVAGLAVLVYGIALFVPLTRLFTTLASMPVAPPWSPGS